MKLFKPKTLKINDTRILDYLQVYFPTETPDIDKEPDIPIYEFEAINVVYDGYTCIPDKDIIYLKFSFMVNKDDMPFSCIQLSIPIKIVKSVSAILDTSNNIENNRLLISGLIPFLMTSHFHRINKDEFYLYAKYSNKSEHLNYIKLTINLKHYIFIHSIISSLNDHKDMYPLINSKLLLSESYKCIDIIPFNIDINIDRYTYDDKRKRILLLTSTDNAYLVILVGADKLSKRYIENKVKKNSKYIPIAKFLNNIWGKKDKPVIAIKNKIPAYFANNNTTDDIDVYYFLEDIDTISKDEISDYTLRCIEFRKTAYETFIQQITDYVENL